jgi:hypothetical protein
MCIELQLIKSTLDWSWSSLIIDAYKECDNSRVYYVTSGKVMLYTTMIQ